MTSRPTHSTPARATGKLRFGPGLLVTAAFVGPGTVVTASRAGAAHGCELLWTIAFAVVGAIVLQALAARVGILQQTGLGEAIREQLGGSRWLRPAMALIIAAIGVGNAAYQTGNLTGAATGCGSLVGGSPHGWVLLLACLTIVIILVGKFRQLQNLLIGLVVLLSLAFLSTASLSLPTASRIARGLLTPSVSLDNLSLVIGLIGTTIVPYNLFLHASAAAATWKQTEPSLALANARWDTIGSIALGGLVTAAILLTASSAFYDAGVPLDSATQIAEQLRPTLGAYSGAAFAVGLFAAGLTSSITAPLAAAYAVCGCVGWKADPTERRFRAIALSVVVIGAACALAFGKSPSQTIVFAQVANGILLPVVALFLILVVQRAYRHQRSLSARFALAGAWLVVGLVSGLGIWRTVTALW